MQKWSDVVPQKYVFAPHRIIQFLHNQTLEVLHKCAKEPIQRADLKIELNWPSKVFKTFEV
jgi:hypothetical protein